MRPLASRARRGALHTHSSPRVVVSCSLLGPPHCTTGVQQAREHSGKARAGIL